MEKKDNIRIKIKHIGLLEKKKFSILFFHFNLIKRNKKKHANFFYLQNQFRRMSQKKTFFLKKIHKKSVLKLVR